MLGVLLEQPLVDACAVLVGTPDHEGIGRERCADRPRATPSYAASAHREALRRMSTASAARTRRRARRELSRTVVTVSTTALLRVRTPRAAPDATPGRPRRRRAWPSRSRPTRTRRRAERLQRPVLRGGVVRRSAAQARRRSRCGSWPSISTPETPSATAVRRPPTDAATTGVPTACDSMATSPNDSLYDGTTVTSAARYQSTRSACAPAARSAPRQQSRARAPAPRGDAGVPVQSRSVHRPRRPPARRGARGAGSSSSAAARSSTSGALSGWIRPTNSKHVGRRREPRRRLAPGGPGGEHAEVDAWWHRGHLPGGASYRSISCAASCSGVGDQPVGGGQRPRSRRSLVRDGSGTSPSASSEFLTLAIVCIEWTSGTCQRSCARVPTCPDSQ